MYNPVVYEVQSITFDGSAGTISFALDTSTTRVGSAAAASTGTVDAAVLAAGATSDAKAANLVKTNLETLVNIDTVAVSRVTNTGEVRRLGRTK